MNKSMIRYSRAFTGTMVVMAVLWLSIPAFASWNLVMYEDFERDANTWRWANTGNTWRVEPWGPPTSTPHWGIQDFIYKPHPVYPERFRQASWCDASTFPGAGGRDPEFDRYRTNMHTHMSWGPFSTVGFRDARASFEWVNRTALGDTFFWEAATSTSNIAPHPINQRPLWFRAAWTERWVDTLGNLHDTIKRGWHSGDAMSSWRYNIISLDSVDSAGTIISLMNRPNVFVGWRFKSNAILDSLVGAVVENIRISRDDGLFDLEVMRTSVMMARDSAAITYPQAQDTVIFFCEYKIRGNGILLDTLGNPVWTAIQCQVNSVLPPFYYDTIMVNAGEEETRYRVYTGPFILPIEGPYTVTWTLDPGNIVFEGGNENNNIGTFQFEVVAPNYPPTLEFLSSVPVGDTILVNRYRIDQILSMPLLIRAYDPDDGAGYYVYNHLDTIPGSGSLISSNRIQPITETDTVDTLIWSLRYMQDGYWYVSATIQDTYNETEYVMAPFVVQIQTVSSTNDPIGSQLPTTTEIQSAYPNPFNSEVKLLLGLARNGFAEVSFHDISGREVDRLVVPSQQAGWQSVTWRPRSMASGVYIARLNLNGQAIHTTKLMYLK